MTTSSELIAQFPRLFRGRGPRTPGYVGPGWHALLVRLFERIDALLSDDEAAAFEVLQIKEKYGGLRVYVSLAGDTDVHVDLRGPQGLQHLRIGLTEEDAPLALERVRALIDEAAAEAGLTCEKCGAPGKLRVDGWMSTLCDRHDVERRLSRAASDLPEDGT